MTPVSLDRSFLPRLGVGPRVDGRGNATLSVRPTYQGYEVTNQPCAWSSQIRRLVRCNRCRNRWTVWPKSGEQWRCGRCARRGLHRRETGLPGFHLATGQRRGQRTSHQSALVKPAPIVTPSGEGADRIQPAFDSDRSRENWSRTTFVPPRTTGPMNRPTTPNTMMPPKMPTVMTATLRAPLRLMIAGRR